MRKILPLFLLLIATPAFAQTAGDMVAQQIGQLTIQNANLAEQLNKANARVKELESKHAEDKPKDAMTGVPAKP